MRDPTGWPTLVGSDAVIWSRYVIVAVLAIAVAGVVHAGLGAILRRAAARPKTLTDDILLPRLRGPTRWLFAGVALVLAQPALHLGPIGRDRWSFVAGLVTPALFGWLAIAL